MVLRFVIEISRYFVIGRSWKSHITPDRNRKCTAGFILQVQLLEFNMIKTNGLYRDSHSTLAQASSLDVHVTVLSLVSGHSVSDLHQVPRRAHLHHSV